MNKNNSIMMGIGGMLALVISLPLEWMTIKIAKMNIPQFGGGFEGLGNMMSSTFGNMSTSVTGFNGHVTLLAKLPIWLIVVVGLMGVLLAVLNSLRITMLPKYVPLIPMAISAIYVLATLLIAAGSSEATVGIGGFVAIIGLAMGCVLGLDYQSVPRGSVCCEE